MYTPAAINRSTKYGNNYWESYSPKMKRNIRLFSNLEYDNWVFIETNPHIKEFCEQPKKIEYLLDGKLHHSIFDMWICYDNDEEVFIEVKYSSELDPLNPKSKRALRQTKIQENWCNDNGYSYIIRTEKEIRNNMIYLDNLKYILANLKIHQYAIETDTYMLLKILNQSKLSVKSIIEQVPISSSQRVVEALSWLIYDGKVSANIDTKIFDFETEVWLNAQYKSD